MVRETAASCEDVRSSPRRSDCMGDVDMVDVAARHKDIDGDLTGPMGGPIASESSSKRIGIRSSRLSLVPHAFDQVERVARMDGAPVSDAAASGGDTPIVREVEGRTASCSGRVGDRPWALDPRLRVWTHGAHASAGLVHLVHGRVPHRREAGRLLGRGDHRRGQHRDAEPGGRRGTRRARTSSRPRSSRRSTSRAPASGTSMGDLWQVAGDLTIKETTREVALDAVFGGAVTLPPQVGGARARWGSRPRRTSTGGISG